MVRKAIRCALFGAALSMLVAAPRPRMMRWKPVRQKAGRRAS